MSFKDGSYYEGNWKDGKRNGKGKYMYPSLNWYEGDWLNNKREGKGTMNWIKINEKYCGEWKEDIQNGFGTHIWLEERGVSKLMRNRYEGYWLNGMRHGTGVFFYANGSKYEGEWKSNLKDGYGIFTFEDGTQYAGPFEKDKMVNRALQSTILSNANDKSIASQANETKAPKSKQPAKKEEKKKQQLTLPATKTITTVRAKKESEGNPYKAMLSIEDILVNADEPENELKEVQNIMLRKNVELKKLYQKYSTEIELVETEESFALTIKQFWRFLRDYRIVDPYTTIAEINRAFLKSPRTRYPIHYDFVLFKSDAFQQQLDFAMSKDKKEDKKADQTKGVEPKEEEKEHKEIDTPGASFIKESQEHSEDAKDLSKKLENMEQIEKVGDESEDEVDDLISPFESSEWKEDVHEHSRIMLQRHFLEALIRVANVKYSHQQIQLPEKLSNLIQWIFNKDSFKSSKTQDLEAKERAFKDDPYYLDLFQKSCDRKISYSIHMRDCTMPAHRLARIFKQVGVDDNIYPLLETINNFDKKYGTGDANYDEDIENMEVIYYDFMMLMLLTNSTSKFKQGYKLTDEVQTLDPIQE
jgi:hypothetical protein